MGKFRHVSYDKMRQSLPWTNNGLARQQQVLTLGKADNIEDKEQDVSDNEEHLGETSRVLSDLISFELQVQFIRHLILW